MTQRRILLAATIAALAVGSTSLVACAFSKEGSSAAQSSHKVGKARSDNTLRTVDPRFGQKPRVLAAEDGSGVQTSALFFDEATAVILTGPTVAEQLRGASIAAVAYAPVLGWSPQAQEAVRAELNRLHPHKVLVVGEVPVAELVPEGVTVLIDDGSQQELAELTTLEFTTKEVEKPADLARAVAGLEAKNPTELVASWEKLPGAGSQGAPRKQGAFPVSSPRDGGTAPVVIASPQSSILDVANARAYGVKLRFMDYPDPRYNEQTLEMVAGLADKPLLALGSAFGSDSSLAQAIRLGETTVGEINGGGILALPGRRMVALYGHPSGPALGVLGSMNPAQAVDHARQLAEEYARLNPAEPVIPAFEVIATVAAAQPGPEQKYTNYTNPEELKPYIEAITKAGGYAVIDLQPGRASFLEQAKHYEELLRDPNVGLALDPEWKIGPDEVPLQRVGHAEAAEINEVAEWLARLTAEHKLPQKVFVVHQFQLQMLRDRESINTDLPELAFVLHADGHGNPGQKFDTWNALRAGLAPQWFMAWKNFTKEDSPTFTPAQTFEIEPRPWFVSYQ